MNGPALADSQGDTTPILRRALAHLDRNEVLQAESLLLPALSGGIEDAQALQLMGVIRRLQGRLSDAEEFYRRSLAIEPAQPQVHHNLGNLLKMLGRLDEAIAETGEAIRLKPNFAEAHLNLALTLSDKGDHNGAEKSCRAALRLQPNYLLAKQCLATELCVLGRSMEAERLLRQTLSLGVRDPRQVAALEHTLGVALKEQRRFHEALRLFDLAQAKVPEMLAVDYNRGNVFQQLGLLENAIASYRQAILRQPDHVDALACLALMLTQTGDFSDARAFGERAVALDPRHSIALIALAIVDVEEGASSRAEDRLSLVLHGIERDRNGQTSFALGFAADAFDRTGRVSEAFALHKVSNEGRRDVHVAAFGNARVTDDIGRLTAYFKKSEAWSASPAPVQRSHGAAGHVFLLGFMRSGTTLLETVLATNPQIVGMDEIEFLTGAAREFLLSEAGLDRLSAIGADEADKWRDTYWNSVRNAGLSVAGKVFIDKMPFNSLRLPLISRLFPTARVLFALRDPRDVVLSCFRRRFSLTPYSFEFFRLDDCARLYASAMTLAELYREKLPLDLREHRYEDIVADFDSSVRDICEFIGIEWSASMRDFGGVAQAIDRRSASAAQVRRGLYQGAAGQWRRYAEQLSPVLSILQPWVEKFGYPAD
jgi:tetratricopeptide (TPR) repeat protein